MICNSKLTVYHMSGYDVSTNLEVWTRFNYDNVWFFGGKGAGINKGYDNANDVQIRIPYNQNNVNVANFSIGDILVFYRTGGYYKSVVTTIGEVVEVKTDFQDENDFILYCRKKSVYPEQALREMWRYSTRTPFVVNFLYTYSFPHRINMKELIDLKVLQGVNDAPRGFKLITKEQFETILKETRSDESFIIN